MNTITGNIELKNLSPVSVLGTEQNGITEVCERRIYTE